jgi:hypothetical protein
VTQSDEITRRKFLHIASAAVALGASSRAGASEGNLASGGGPAASPAAKRVYDLASLKWQVSGFIPWLWSIDRLADIHSTGEAEIGPIDAPVPGSVQQALLNAGVLPDWNVGLSYRQAE